MQFNYHLEYIKCCINISFYEDVILVHIICWQDQTRKIIKMHCKKYHDEGITYFPWEPNVGLGLAGWAFLIKKEIIYILTLML